jgi:hypothetical protein
MTDKQLFMVIKRLDKRIQRLRAGVDDATFDLAILINAIHELRADRNDWREEARALAPEK